MPVNDDGIGPTGRFPRGKLNEEDQGEIQMAIGTDLVKNVVMVHFGAPMKWLALDRTTALAMSESLRQKAEQLREEENNV